MVIFAFWISGICGGGASLILIPLLNLYLPASLVPFSITIGSFSSSVSRIILFRRYISWKVFWAFIPAAIPAVFIGAGLLKYINPNYLQLIISFLLLSNLIEFLKPSKEIDQNTSLISVRLVMIIGFFAGLISGITGAIGLLFNKFYFKMGLKKEEILATRAANEIFLHFIKLITYFSVGLYSPAALKVGLLIAIAAFISSQTIRYILPWLSDRLFKKIGYGAMVLSGLILLSSSARHISESVGFNISSKITSNEIIVSAFVNDWSLAIELSPEDFCELEFNIDPKSLPVSLAQVYTALRPQYDSIKIQRVISFSPKHKYEFYCLKENKLTKIKI